MSIAFTPDTLKNAKKDFVGVIIDSQYIDNVRFGGKQLKIEIQTEDYDKNQYESATENDSRVQVVSTENLLSPNKESYLEYYQIGFLEALLDAEGALFMARERRRRKNGRLYIYKPKVTVNSTDKVFLEKVQDVIGGGGIYNQGVHIGFGTKQQWLYYIHKPLMRKWLPKIGLAIKDRQRLLLIEALDITSGHGVLSDNSYKRLEEIYEEVRSLNKKGVNTYKGRDLDVASRV